MSARRIIILEPEDELASMVERFLLENSFDVARVREPAQLKWMTPLIKPHVVLVDYQPKECIEIAKHLRRNGADSDVALVMVIHQDYEDKYPKVAKQLKELYDGLLYKPFEDSDLLRVIENFTGFGDSSEDEVGVALDKLLDVGSANPELQKVLDNLKETQAKNGKVKPPENNGAKEIASFQEKLQKLEAELAFSKNQNKHQSEKIMDLLNQLNEKIEQDQTAKIKKMEIEKLNLEKEVEMLYGRIEEIEGLLNEFTILFSGGQKKISEFLDKS